jgi:hypothetical protein
MHPDEAVQLAIQDLRTQHAPAPKLQARERSLASRLLHAYFGALSWYVQDGRTPVADAGAAVGHLLRMRLSFDAAEPAVDAALLPLCAEAAR